MTTPSAADMAARLSKIAHDGVVDGRMRHDIGLLLAAEVATAIAQAKAEGEQVARDVLATRMAEADRVIEEGHVLRLRLAAAEQEAARLRGAAQELITAEASVRMEHSTPEYRRYAEALRKLTVVLAAQPASKECE